MRIALVTHQFFPSSSTEIERSILNLANQLTRMGHEAIVVVLAEHSSKEASSYAYEGTWVRTVEAGEVDRLVNVLREESSDVVHVMQPSRLPQALKAAERLGLPVVVHIADSADLRDAEAKTLLTHAAAVVSPSRATIERHADEGFDTAAWHHIPSSTDVPPSLEEEAWMLEGIYVDCLVNARA